MAASKQIEIWYDEMSDPDEPVWCVSVCDPDGEEIKCLSTHGDKDDAITAGSIAARKRSLQLCERDKHGCLTTIV